ncbi:MAG: peptidase C39 family protein [Thermoplasmata archaeon]|nr:peptidase C39 family protein [Thermoplasmata archaeon]
MKLQVPFYRQKMDFTCGPACLMMAMKYFDKRTKMNRRLEMDIWREANLEEMWGTVRYGLALAAHKRGFPVKIINSGRGMGYAEVVSETRKEIIKKWVKFFFKELKDRCSEANIKEIIKNFGVDEIRKILKAGAIPIVLINPKFLTGEDIAHWIVVKGFDKNHFYINNPYDHPKKRKGKITTNMMRKSLGYGGKKALVAVYSKPIH